MHFDQLRDMTSMPHDEEHPFRAPVECKGFSLLEENHLFINGLSHFVRTPAPILHARLTPAFRRDRHSCPHGKRLANVMIAYVPLPSCDRSGGGEHFFKDLCRHDSISNLIG
jgi:hypothetical protein